MLDDLEKKIIEMERKHKKEMKDLLSGTRFEKFEISPDKKSDNSISVWRLQLILLLSMFHDELDGYEKEFYTHLKHISIDNKNQTFISSEILEKLGGLK